MLRSGKFLSLLKRILLFYLHQNELIAYYQQTNRIHLQILYSKHFRFPQRPYVDKRYLCRLHTGTYNYLTMSAEYHLGIAKTTKVPI